MSENHKDESSLNTSDGNSNSRNDVKAPNEQLQSDESHRVIKIFFYIIQCLVPSITLGKCIIITIWGLRKTFLILSISIRSSSDSCTNCSATYTNSYAYGSPPTNSMHIYIVAEFLIKFFFRLSKTGNILL